jgi:hypothetical protein
MTIVLEEYSFLKSGRTRIVKLVKKISAENIISYLVNTTENFYNPEKCTTETRVIETKNFNTDYESALKYFNDSKAEIEVVG